MQHPHESGFRPHGHYRLARQGQVVFLTMKGTWNEECVARFEDEFPRFLVSAGVPQPWGVLTDLRHWGGATPEAMERIAGNMPWLHGLGMAASARVLSESFLNSLLDHSVHQDSPYAVFGSIEAGLNWLATRGFAAD